MRLLIFLAILVTASMSCRTAQFRTIKVNTAMHGTISYPVFKYHDRSVEKKINAEIASAVFQDEDTTGSNLENRLQQLTESTYALYHTITYNRNGLLSFNIYHEVCGAHCGSEVLYFNFNLGTGDRISLSDLAMPEKINDLEKLIADSMKRRLEDYKNVELAGLAAEDSLNYEWVMESMNHCIEGIEISDYSITPEGIEFINDCSFPHAIRNYDPPNTISFGKKELTPYLRSGFLKLFDNK